MFQMNVDDRGQSRMGAIHLTPLRMPLRDIFSPFPYCCLVLTDLKGGCLRNEHAAICFTSNNAC